MRRTPKFKELREAKIVYIVCYFNQKFFDLWNYTGIFTVAERPIKCHNNSILGKVNKTFETFIIHRK